MQLWRPKSSTICLSSAGWRSRKAGGMILFESEGPRNEGATGITPRVQKPMNQKIWCPRAGKDGSPSLKRKKEFAFPLSFYAIWALSILGDACPHWRGWLSLLRLMNQILISSRNAPKWCFTSCPGIVYPIEMTHGINHHSPYLPFSSFILPCLWYNCLISSAYIENQLGKLIFMFRSPNVIYKA